MPLDRDAMRAYQADRRARARQQPVSEEVVADEDGEDRVNGLPRSNYLTTEPTQTWIVERAEKDELHGNIVTGPIKELPGLVATIQTMSQQHRDAILRKIVKQ